MKFRSQEVVLAAFVAVSIACGSGGGGAGGGGSNNGNAQDSSCKNSGITATVVITSGTAPAGLTQAACAWLHDNGTDRTSISLGDMNEGLTPGLEYISSNSNFPIGTGLYALGGAFGLLKATDTNGTLYQSTTGTITIYTSTATGFYATFSGLTLSPQGASGDSYSNLEGSITIGNAH